MAQTLTADEVVYETMKEKIFAEDLSDPWSASFAVEILHDGYDYLKALDSPILGPGLRVGDVVRVGKGKAQWEVLALDRDRDRDQASLAMVGRYHGRRRRTTVHTSRLTVVEL